MRFSLTPDWASTQNRRNASHSTSVTTNDRSHDLKIA
jgi:hypothetical protein